MELVGDITPNACGRMIQDSKPGGVAIDLQNFRSLAFENVELSVEFSSGYG